MKYLPIFFISCGILALILFFIDNYAKTNYKIQVLRGSIKIGQSVTWINSTSSSSSDIASSSSQSVPSVPSNSLTAITQSTPLSSDLSSLSASSIRYVFFDLGANKGDSLGNFFGLESTGGGGNLHNLFPPGLIENNSWIVYAYEANPRFDKNLTELRAKIPKKHQVSIYNSTAAWIYDGEIEFYLDLLPWEALGSSVKPEHEFAKRSNFTKIKVPCHDIARILNQYNENDIIIMKMDIEGAEYDLIIDLVTKGVLRHIDYLAIEYHTNTNTFKFPQEVFDKLIELYGIKKFNWV